MINNKCINPALKRRFKSYGTKHIDNSLTLFRLFLDNNGKCNKCGINTTLGEHPQTEKSATIEHIIPLSEGGNHVCNNVTLLCHKCNSQVNRDRLIRNNITKVDTKKSFTFRFLKYKITIEKDS